MSNTLCIVSPATGRKGRPGGFSWIRFSEVAELVLLVLAPLAPARAVLAADDADAPAEAADTVREGTGDAQRGEVPRKRFGLAAADLAAALAVPWALDRYVADDEWSHISMRTLGGNVRAGFCYDDDDLLMNQMGHPLHGSAYFNAGRTNGFTFWESTLVATLGSLAWEYGFENTAPSRNDMLNTVLGGSVLGESGFRISRALLDNTSTGTTRVFRELAGALVNPVSGINRLVTGEAWRKGPNPEDRLPDRLGTEVAVGGARSRGTHHEDQGFAALQLRWGDPFESPVKKPFDSFDLALRVAAPARTAVTTASVRGVLGAWRLGEAGDGPEHLFGVGMRYDYLTPDSESFAGESFEFGLFSRYPLRKGLEVRTEAQAVVFPIAAFETFCPRRAARGEGRTHDYSVGGGPRLDARLTRDGIDLVRLSWAAAWLDTSNGATSSTRVQWARAEGRWPVVARLTLGAAWSWYERSSSYPAAPAVTKTHTQGSVFVSWHSR
ncbi:MAG: DUF3943 domain-containing protein [Thermoanaerobaculia bacterium]